LAAVKTSITIFFLTLLLIECAVAQPAERLIRDKASASSAVTSIPNPEDSDALDAVIDPDTYVVGPGDQFTIVYTGKLVKRNTLAVTPEGVLLVPEFGPIEVAGITLSEVKGRILRALKSRYMDVPISAFLTKIRSIKVSVSGKVEDPGIFVLSAGDRVSEALRRAGGANEGASRRNIRLFRGDSLIIVDLLKYFVGADSKENPYIREGDVIVVPSREISVNQIGIYGAVRSAGVFEYSQNDMLSDLILLAHGLTSDADSLDFEIVRFNDDGISSRTIQVSLPDGDAWTDSVARIRLLPDDRLLFRHVPEYHQTAQVSVMGEVVYPGVYPIIEDSTRLSEIIERAGGLNENASLSEAWMDRAGYESLEEADFERRLKLSEDKRDDVEQEYLKFQSTGRPGRVSVDFQRLLVDKDGAYDIVLKNGDRVQIPSLSRTVRVIGRVIRPGLVEYSPNKDFKYYIEQSGGYGWKANKGRVRVIKASSRAIVELSRDIPIEVGDAIVIPESIDRDWWGIIKDVGTFLAHIATVYIVIDQVIE